MDKKLNNTDIKNKIFTTIKPTFIINKDYTNSKAVTKNEQLTTLSKPASSIQLSRGGNKVSKKKCTSSTKSKKP